MMREVEPGKFVRLDQGESITWLETPASIYIRFGIESYDDQVRLLERLTGWSCPWATHGRWATRPYRVSQFMPFNETEVKMLDSGLNPDAYYEREGWVHGRWIHFA